MSIHEVPRIGCHRERFGPADDKVWATSEISGDSVGRGESVPAGLILPQVAGAINELAAGLGYLPVDADWGTPGRAADPRAPDSICCRASALSVSSAPGSGPLEECLRSQIESTDERFVGQWESCAAERFLIVSRAAIGGGETQWLVDAAARTITIESETGDDGNDDNVMWSVLGTPQTWEAVLTGQLNLHAALRHNDLRYCPADNDSSVASQTRITMLADLLGLSAWARAASARRDMAEVS